MKKLIGLFLALVLLLITAAPALAGCRTVTIEMRGYKFVRTYCSDPIPPVIEQNVEVNSTDGDDATAISVLVVRTNWSFISNSLYTFANTGGLR